MLKRILLALISALLLSLPACGPTPKEDSALTAAESKLVDIYVRLSIMEALRSQNADSVDTQLNWMYAHLDTAAVGRALASLELEPTRWALFHDTVGKRLTELEQLEEDWWDLVTGERSLSEPFE